MLNTRSVVLALGLVMSLVNLNQGWAGANTPSPISSFTPGSQMLPPIGTDPDFGDVFIGQSAQIGTTWTVALLTGESDSTITFYDMSVIGSPDFQLTQNTCNGFVAINTGQYYTYCLVQVTFTPTQTGQEDAALILNTSSGIFSYPYQGTGVSLGSMPQAIDNSSIASSADGLDLNTVYAGIPLVVDGYDLESDEPYCPTCGDPVNLATGTLWHANVDFDLPGRTKVTDLLFKRTYVENPVFRPGDFGPRWMHTWETKLLAETGSAFGNLVWINPTGGTSVFVRNSDGSYNSPPGFFGSLTEFSDHYDLKMKHAVHYIFSRDSSVAPIGRLTQITEPHGESVQLSYANGLLSGVSTGLAGAITFTRNSAGLITQVIRQRDNLVYNYSYDSAGRLASSADFDGNTTQYSYATLPGDPAPGGLLVSVTDPIGRVFSNSFNSKGIVTAQGEPGNAVRSYQYIGSSTYVTDVDGNNVGYIFNSNFLLLQSQYPDGTITETHWTPQNQVASFEDARGFTTQYTYDSDGNMASIQKPLDVQPTVFTYDPSFDQLILFRPIGNVAPTYTQINANNGDILEIQRNGETVLSDQITYDSFGNPVSFNNGLASFFNQTDSNGLLTFIYDQRNPETRKYDTRGRVIMRSYKSGKSLSYTWDNHDRITRVDDSTGPSTLFNYDVVNRLLSKVVTDGKTKQKTEYEWDARNRLSSETDPLGAKTEFKYDTTKAGVLSVIDQPRAKIDPDGNKTTFDFDVRDRLVKKTDARGGETKYKYDRSGNRSAVIDPLGQETQFKYDGNNRLEKETRPSMVTSSAGVTTAIKEEIHYHYDQTGRLERIVKPSLQGGKSVVQLYYDLFGRVSAKVQKRVDKEDNEILIEDLSDFTYLPILDRALITGANNGVEELSFGYDPAPPYAPVAYSAHAADPKNALGLIEGDYTVEYDGTNQIQSIIDAASGKDLFTSNHDEAGRLLEIASGGFMKDATPLAATMKYDSFGRKAQVSFSDRSSGTMQYDLKNRVSEINWQTGGLWFMSDKISEQLNYDPVGNVLAQTREFGKLSYQYDPSNELTSVSAQGTEKGFFGKFEDKVVARDLSQTYGYDLAGNRTLASISGASQFVDNQIVSNAHSTFQSDADGFGNLSSEILNDSAHFTRNYTYRTDGKLTQMDVVFDREWRCDPQVTQVVTQTQYSYDALGRRAAKLTTFKPNLGHGMGPAMGYTQSFSYLGNQDKILLAKSGDGITSLYLDGQGIDEHLGKVSKRGTQPYFTDHLGSVLNTAIAGGLQSYDSYGRTIAGFPLFAEVLSSDPVNYGFAGRQFDIESEKYYNRARMYDPATGRFLNQDPLGLKGGLNLYRYAKNNPLSYVDPYGRSPLGCMLGGALLGVSVVYGGAFIYGAYTGGTYLAGYLAADSAINGSAGLWGLYVGAAAGLGWSIPSASSDPTYSLGDFDYGYGGDDEDSSTFNFGGFLNQAPGSPSLGVNTDIGSSDFSSDSSSGDGS